MPVTNAGHRIDVKLLGVNNAVAYFLRQNIQVDLNLYRCHPNVGWKCLVVSKPDPHEIEWHHDAVVARFQSTHQSKTEIGKDITETCVHAGLMAQRTDRAVQPRQPQIRGNRHVPPLIRWFRWVRQGWYWVGNYRRLRIFK